MQLRYRWAVRLASDLLIEATLLGGKKPRCLFEFVDIESQIAVQNLVQKFVVFANRLFQQNVCE